MQVRMDTLLYLLVYPQKPLVTTKTIHVRSRVALPSQLA